MRSLLRACAIAAAVTVGGARAASADTAWSIGTPDGSYADLAIAANHPAYPARFGSGVAFIVGQDARHGWPFIQPGPVDAWAGNRSHTFRARFTLQDAPRGAYRLSLHLLGAHATAPPAVEVLVNGARVGRAQLRPGPGDHLLAAPDARQRSAVSFAFPAGRLWSGPNEVAIVTRSGSWLLYDAVTLETGTDVPTVPVLDRVSAHCTPFFRKVGGQMRQAIALDLLNTGVEGPVDVKLSGAAQHASRLQVGSGANLHHVLVPPIRSAGRARVTLTAAGREVGTDVDLRPERMWRVYVVPASHTDIGYTNVQPATIAGHNANTALALERMRRDPALVWNLEVGWQERAFRSGLDDPAAAPTAAKRPSAEVAELGRRLREGRLGLPGMYLNMLTGLCDGEELARVVGWPVQAGMAHGVAVAAAHLTDVPSAVGTLPMLLRQAGVRYFVEGMNQSHGPVFRLARKPPYQTAFWWEGMDGSRVLTHFADGYGQGSGLGMATGVEAMAALLPGWLRAFERDDYLPDAVLAYGMFSDNMGLDPAYSSHIRAWNATWDFPRVVQARAEDYFRYVERGWGKRLPVYRGDMGVYWEDGAASTARETGLTRWARTRLDAAQRRAALEAFAGAPFPAKALREGWENAILFNEHTWGAHNSFSEPAAPFVKQQWAWKAGRAERAAHTAERVVLSRVTKCGSGDVFVRNLHSWPRDIVAWAPWPTSAQPIAVIDVATGQAVPSQRVAGRVVFLARAVPSFGHRRYSICEPRAAPRPILMRGADAWSWFTPRWRLRIDPSTGGLASLVDARTGHEWAKPGGRSLNQYVWVRGGENSRVIEPQYAPPSLQEATHQRAVVDVVENGPARAVLHIRREGPAVCPVDTWLVLDAAGGMRFVNVLHQNGEGGKVAGYFAFPLAFGRPADLKGYVELPYGYAQVDAEQMPGACRDWHASAGFSALTDGTRTATLVTAHAPCVTFNDIVRGLWRDRYEPLNGDLYSYALSHYWYTNYRYSQPGDILLEFALSVSSGPFDPAAATRASWDALARSADPRRAGRPDVWDTAVPAWYEPDGGPGLSVSGGPVVGGLDWRNGRLQVRLYNPSRRPGTAGIRVVGRSVRSARVTDLVGRPKQALRVAAGSFISVPVPARGIATVELEPARRPKAAGGKR